MRKIKKNEMKLYHIYHSFICKWTLTQCTQASNKNIRCVYICTFVTPSVCAFLVRSLQQAFACMKIPSGCKIYAAPLFDCISRSPASRGNSSPPPAERSRWNAERVLQRVIKESGEVQRRRLRGLRIFTVESGSGCCLWITWVQICSVRIYQGLEP